MRILFDHNVPVYLAKLFLGHDVVTAYRQGWASLRNGRLLEVAEEAGFELLVTMDQNMGYQQRVKGRRMCIAVLDPQGQAEEDVLAAGLSLLRRIVEVQPETLMIVKRVDP